MFILTTQSNGQIKTLELGTRARYDQLRDQTPELIFLEEIAAKTAGGVAAVIRAPQSFMVLYGTYLVPIST